MRLLNTSTYEFEEFIKVPEWKYAIHSHRWTTKEVSYKEFRKPTDEVKKRTGYQKIIDFCNFAKERKYKYAWIDTCCIDKRSSAELSEAINSMYMWYRMSGECHVLLADYQNGLRGCEWLKRGWTLQELLAPEVVVFCTADWRIIGHKHNHRFCLCESPKSEGKKFGKDLVPSLARNTRIPEDYLSKKASRRQASIAQRMSWASERRTERIEDKAYCLLGLFDINMPLVYGEGAKAFQRLQHEILRVSEDTSIFCFIPVDRANKLLATSPADFYHSRRVEEGRLKSTEPYSITNKGLRIYGFVECVTSQKISSGRDPHYEDGYHHRYDTDNKNRPAIMPICRIYLGCKGPVLDEETSQVSKNFDQQYLVLRDVGRGQSERLTSMPISARWEPYCTMPFHVRLH